MSDHQLHQCSLPFHRHSGTEAFRNEVDLAQELGLVQVEELAELALAAVWEWEDLVGLVWVLEEEEDPQKAKHTFLPCTSFPFHIANQGCTSSHTGGRECHTEHDLHVFLPGSLLGTPHRKSYRLFHK